MQEKRDNFFPNIGVFYTKGAGLDVKTYTSLKHKGHKENKYLPLYPSLTLY